MLLAKLSELLDRENVRYSLFSLSPAHAPEEVSRHFSTRGIGLIEAAFFELDGESLAMAIFPASLSMDLPALSSLLSPRSMRVLSPAEVAARISPGEIPPVGKLFDVPTFVSPLVADNLAVGFFADSERTLISMDREEFQRLCKGQSTTPVPTRTKYRAYADPARKKHDSCILGISLENPDFATAKLITITDWIRRHFSHCSVMLGDSLHRITLQMERDMEENQALDYSLWLARNFVHAHYSLFQQKNSSCAFDFVFCSDVQRSQAYGDYYREIRSLFLENRAFKDSVSDFAHRFVNRKTIRNRNADLKWDMSCAYLIEELAVLCCLSGDSPRTFVYPGSLTILEEISEGKHPCVPKFLLDMEFVDLHLKRRH